MVVTVALCLAAVAVYFGALRGQDERGYTDEDAAGGL
jgi:hypothetical protein